MSGTDISLILNPMFSIHLKIPLANVICSFSVVVFLAITIFLIAFVPLTSSKLWNQFIVMFNASQSVSNEPFTFANFSLNFEYDGLQKYCPINSDLVRLKELVKLNASVTVAGSEWVVRPFSFAMLRHNRGHFRDRHIIVVHVESLSFNQLLKKFPRTVRKVNELLKSDYQGSILNVVRSGGNSPPNRGAFLLGLDSTPQQVMNTPEAARLGSRSLKRIAEEYEFDFSISDTILSSCGGKHTSLNLKILVGRCEQFKDAYNTIMKKAACTEPWVEDKSCKRFPYPVKYLPYNCSHVSMHDLMIATTMEDVRSSRKYFAILNFNDYHPPNKNFVSTNFDAAVEKLLADLEKFSENFSFLLLGDHGHGANGEYGNAGGIFLGSRKSVSDSVIEIIKQPAVTALDLNRIIRRQIGGICAEREIRPMFCFECRIEDEANIESGWHLHLHFNATELSVTSKFPSRSILDPVVDNANYSASIGSYTVCRDITEKKIGGGFTLTLNVGHYDDCAETIVLQFTSRKISGDVVIAQIDASNSYGPFQDCVNVTVVAEILDMDHQTSACVIISPGEPMVVPCST